MPSPVVDDGVLRAAAEVIAAHGWHELTLERVAAAAGISRVTLYRRGVTRDVLIDALSVGAAQAWQAAIWPALAGPGDAAERLIAALRATCEVAEAHLGLLAGLGTAPEPMFHLDAPLPTRMGAEPDGPGHQTRQVYVAPFARLLRDGAIDHTLAAQPDPQATATALFNIVPRTYVHLRVAHGWEPEATTTMLTSLLLHGLLPHHSAGTRG